MNFQRSKLLKRALGLFLSLVLLCIRAAADPVPWPLPADVTMNKGAGRGNWLIVTLRLESGEEFPVMVDTGSPITLLDRSLEQKLGKRLETMMFSSPAGGRHESGVYPAPKLYLGDTLLATDSYTASYPFKQLSARSHQRVMGILGLDCLRYYRVQLDFQAGKMRFLDSNQMKAIELGKAFPISFSSKGQKPPPLFSNACQGMTLPFLDHTGLAGGTNTSLMIDTGDNVDGAIGKGVIKGHYLTRFIHFFIKHRALRVPECIWDGETYTKLKLGTGRNANQLGLRFLARHLVTFDFPKQTMYLKQTSSGLLSPDENKTKSKKVDAASGG